MSNQVNNQSLIPSTDLIQYTLTVKMTTAQVVETSVTVTNNSPIQDYVLPDDHTQPIYESIKTCTKTASCRHKLFVFSIPRIQIVVWTMDFPLRKLVQATLIPLISCF